MYYDFGAFAGRWPFRHLRCRDWQAQRTRLEKLGIGGGYVSSLEAIFYNDPWEADGPLLAALTGEWRLAMCVNPRLPWAEMAVTAAKNRGVDGLRLYPGIHRYPLDAPEVCQVCDRAEELGMAVLVTARMEDDRLCYLLEQQSVDAASMCRLAHNHPGAKFVLSGFYLQELAALEEIPENLWADAGGLCHGLEPVTRLLEGGVPAERLLFGSFSPLQCAESHLLNLPEPVREAALRENGRRFMEGYHA